MATGDVVHVDRDGLFKKLEELDIKTTTVEHPEVFTVEEMMPYLCDLPGVKCKNLFMYGKKKKDLWLMSARHEVEVNLTALSKQVGAPGGLRFASEDRLYETLGVKQGCVTAFALINDKDHKVKFLIDENLVNNDHEQLWFHPMVNSASTGIKPKDLLKFVEHTGHSPTQVKLDAE